MTFEAHHCYHIYNQGNNRQGIFYEPENYLFFLSKVHQLPRPAFTVIAYCLMPNHFHFLIYTDSDRGHDPFDSRNLSRKIGSLLASYTKAINKRYHRTGSLFRPHTQAKCLTSGSDAAPCYLDTCFHYIHQNPLRAKLVEDLEDWPFSSYRDYAGYRNGKLPDIRKGYEITGLNSAEAFIEASQLALDPSQVEGIW